MENLKSQTKNLVVKTKQKNYWASIYTPIIFQLYLIIYILSLKTILVHKKAYTYGVATILVCDIKIFFSIQHTSLVIEFLELNVLKYALTVFSKLFFFISLLTQEKIR